MASSSFRFTFATLIIMVSLFYSLSPILAYSAYNAGLGSQYLPISTPSISAAPAVLPESPLASPSPSYQELSPDITPLLPSPSGGGGEVEPTIPSSPSIPNPDEALIGPDFAYAPDGSLQEISASRCLFSFGQVYKLSMVFGVLCFWLFQALP
ncbi:hypothetical protein LIER_42045 [Lithospermum erythrorhizon]|uniref:Uncharacterized protein n=1 Tax=Lithospermum erythrorhizon TaxID=34254 RepID=A0AAV3RIK1_LITER